MKCLPFWRGGGWRRVARFYFLNYNNDLKKGAFICANSHFSKDARFCLLSMSFPYSVASSEQGQKYFFSVTAILTKNWFSAAWVGFLLFSLLLVPSLPPICLLHQLSCSSWKGRLWFLSQAAGTGLWGTRIQRSSRVSCGISLFLLHLLWAMLQQLLMIFYDFGLKEEQQENPGRVK